METFEVRCAECHKLKWPTLPERPNRYICVLCRMLDPAKRESQRAGQAKRAATLRRTAKKAPGSGNQGVDNPPPPPEA